jgi:hypothetical protein
MVTAIILQSARESHIKKLREQEYEKAKKEVTEAAEKYICLG